MLTSDDVVRTAGGRVRRLAKPPPVTVRSQPRGIHGLLHQRRKVPSSAGRRHARLNERSHRCVATLAQVCHLCGAILLGPVLADFPFALGTIGCHLETDVLDRGEFLPLRIAARKMCAQRSALGLLRIDQPRHLIGFAIRPGLT